MKRVQRAAVERLMTRGFDQATVEEMAAATDVSAMSVHRWFGTKEAVLPDSTTPNPRACKAAVRDLGE